MQNLIKLNQKNIALLPPELEAPQYDRSAVKAGIVHIGVGGFHRAHQAFYTDELLRKHGASDWGICGIALLPHDERIYKTLKEQNGLYTLMVRQEDGSLKARIIGSIVDILFAPENPERVIQKMADESTKIITLTITEGGYNFDSATGEFIKDNPQVQWDLQNPDHPKTVFGYLTQALKRRKEKNLSITIQSCDNIQHNGSIAKKMLLSFMKMQEPDLVPWVMENVSFPNSMVDRITPVTKPEDIRDLADTFGVEDGWPVISEAFHQWIIEDDFKAGRPAWEEFGAQFVTDVHDYEEMKLRILNAGHSLTGLTGVLASYGFIHDAIKDEHIHRLLSEYVDREVIPTMNPVPGIDLKQYKETVIRRFGNPYIKDTVDRIIGESGAKLPKFVFPTITANLKKQGSIQLGTLIVASWFVYLKGKIEKGQQGEVADGLKDLLLPAAQKGALEFIKLKSIFGTLSRDTRFRETYLKQVQSLEKNGVIATIAALI